MNTETLNDRIEAKVAELKKKHQIKEIFVLVSGDKVGYIKKPSRNQLKYAMATAATDPLGLAENILESGWLDGDEELKTKDEYFLDISRQIDSIIETTTVEIKKY